MRRFLLLALVAGTLAAAPTGRAATPVAWCGTDEVSQNRLPDARGSSTRQIRVVYAVPADGADRFLALASPIATDIAAIDAWWQGQDPSRTPRFDLYGFPGCTATFGGLDLGFVRLPHGSAYYAQDETPAPRLNDDLEAGAGADQKTLVYYDGPSRNGGVCGETDYNAPGDGGRFGLAYVYLRSACEATLGIGGGAARTSAHELVHNLGAVTSGAPHYCGETGGHVCDTAADLMFPSLDEGSTLDSAVLDVGRDDYYGHGAGFWDVQDSPWLAHLPLRHLAVSIQGDGAVRATSTGLDCVASCVVDVEDGVEVELLPVAADGSVFAGWSGDCTGTIACTVVLDAPRSVSARFGPAPKRLVVAIAGRGRVVSAPAGIACPGRCSHAFRSGAAVRLTAHAAKRYRFVGWRGACAGRGACLVRADRNRAVRAVFARRRS